MLYWLIWGANDPMLTDNHIQASAISDNADNTDQKAESTKSYFRVKVQEINERTLNRKHERKRNRRKNRSPEAKAAEEVFASNSMDGALTMEDVFQRHTLHQNQRQTLTNFYHSNQMKKEIKTNMLFNSRSQDQMASALNDSLFPAEQRLMLLHQSPQ
jgi:ribosomal protein L23